MISFGVEIYLVLPIVMHDQDILSFDILILCEQPYMFTPRNMVKTVTGFGIGCTYIENIS